MKIKMKRLFGILLSLTLVLGLMPGMGLTAYAAQDSLLTTIYAMGIEQTHYTTENVATVSFEGTSKYIGGWTASPSGSITVNAAEGYTITKCVFHNQSGDFTDENAPFTMEYSSWLPVTTSIDVYGYATTVAVADVSLNKNTSTLTVGDMETLTATVNPGDATDKTVTWSSSDTDVATVENGVVRAVGSGTANITVTATNGTDDTSDDKIATCTVTVNAATPSVVNVTGVEINKTSTTLTVGGTETLTATVRPDGATDKTVTWSSDNTSVATVDANGKVTAVAAGTATITVTTTDGSKTATCSVTVNAADSDSDDDSSSNSSSNDSNNDSSKNNNSSNDSENSNSEPKDETPYDYLEPLRGELKAEIALGGERTVTWDKGTALPYDIMKTLQDNPGVTLIFSYTYQGIDYKVTISGKDAKAYTEIPWYGPLYLYNHYGTLSETAPADTADTAIGTRTYTVIPGDTLSEIATKLNTTVDSLVSLNDIKNRDFILVGQILKY